MDARAWERAEAEADRIREARRTAPPVHQALVHQGMWVLNRFGAVGEVVRADDRHVWVRQPGSWRLRRWPLLSIVEAKAA